MKTDDEGEHRVPAVYERDGESQTAGCGQTREGTHQQGI